MESLLSNRESDQTTPSMQLVASDVSTKQLSKSMSNLSFLQEEHHMSPNHTPLDTLFRQHVPFV